MSATNQQTPQASLTPDHVTRYLRCRERFLGSTQKPSSNGTTIARPTTSADANVASTSDPCSAGLKRIGEASNDLWERIAHLAVTERPADAAPLVTYTTTPGPYGDVVSATPEYIAYMRRKVDGYGSEGACHRPVPDRPPEGVGGEEPVRKKTRAKWMT